MKTNTLLPVYTIILVLLMGGCSKEQDPSLQPESLTSGNSAERNIHSFPWVPELNGVNLGTAENYTILSETAITSSYPASISGDVGLSPTTGAALNLQCTEIYGKIYTVDAAGPSCRITDASRLATAVNDMEAAYKNAALRPHIRYYNVGDGNIGGRTLVSGVYKWPGSVSIPQSVTLSGGPNDVWIFQIDGSLTLNSGMYVHLINGAQTKNVFWVVAGDVTVQPHSMFSGIVLGKAGINIGDASYVDGRLLTQGGVTMVNATVREPVPTKD